MSFSVGQQVRLAKGALSGARAEVVACVPIRGGAAFKYVLRVFVEGAEPVVVGMFWASELLHSVGE